MSLRNAKKCIKLKSDGLTNLKEVVSIKIFDKIDERRKIPVSGLSHHTKRCNTKTHNRILLDMEWLPHSLHINNIKAVWDRHPTKHFGCPSRSMENSFWRLKQITESCLRELSLCWRMKVIIPNTDVQVC